ncbi:hypothetical protein TSUD_359830 [Trifolium subterraneum]|uniref:RNase H type-1 domain-containing protein n=1 Tax=Trifolium subterraneum TaxID=3900 RepID=A0A2Z6MUX0_TRISU|nr:hypothetical protein TSUD_359830 [Trifolium subterraneum]
MKEKWRQAGRDVSRNWDALWSVNAPPKAHHVLWRVCKECIPTRVCLLQRQVVCTPNCPLCNIDAEDHYHAFVLCPQVVTRWAAAGLNHIIMHRLPNFNNVAELLFDICSKEECDIAGHVAAFIWCVWQNRNAKVWSNTQLSSEQVGNQAFQLWKNWFHAQQIRIKQTQQTHTVQPSAIWEKPRDGRLKINVDAGFFEHQGITTTACCVRNSSGDFQCAQTRRYNFNMSILEGESMALLDAVKLATQKGWNFIIFESDSQTLVNAINSRNR